MNLKNVKAMKKLFLLIAATLIAATSFAQVDEVTLTVLGTGVDEEKATLQALRSAIEQSFGTFVSANTTILNDELVQDEIVSVSNGNIKEYKKLAVATLPNKQVSVSLTATVSINKLISYAISKGSKAEFAGSSYAANVKLIRLRAQSTEKAIKLMTQQLEQISKDMFDFEIELSEPTLCDAEHIGKVYYFDCKITRISNIASTNFCNLLYKTIENLILTEQEYKLCLGEKINMVNIDDGQEIRFNTHEPYKSSILPIDYKLYQQYNKKIRYAIRDALFRFSLCEIGNPSNSYVFQQCNMSNGCRYICIGYYESNRKSPVGRYLLYSRKWNELIDLPNGYPFYFLEEEERILPWRKTTGCTRRLYNDLSAYFAMTEIRTPIKLSKKEQKQVEKGTFTGPTYTVTYTTPQKEVIYNRLRVAIPANTMDTFQGFEIKY